METAEITNDTLSPSLIKILGGSFPWDSYHGLEDINEEKLLKNTDSNSRSYLQELRDIRNYAFTGLPNRI